MLQNNIDPARQKQNGLSAALIIINILLAIVYVVCTPQHENNFFTGLLGAAVAAVLLQALFIFTYKGKAPVLSKWILAVFVLVTILYAAFIMYAMALGKAFQH